MKTDLFSEEMKMADLIFANCQLLYVLPYFGIGLGFGDATVKQVCEATGVSVSLFLLVCNVHTFDHYHPTVASMVQIPPEGLMEYLRNSHRDYSGNRMPGIITRILNLANTYGIHHSKILAEFCEKYKKEVIAHFDYEEQVVFPYVKTLLEGKKSKDYNIKEYQRNHSDLDAALSDLKNIFVKYLPNNYPMEKCREILIDLFAFESDINKHALLEDKILVAISEQLERNVR